MPTHHSYFKSFIVLSSFLLCTTFVGCGVSTIQNVASTSGDYASLSSSNGLETSEDALSLYAAVRAAAAEETPDQYLSLVQFKDPEEEVPWIKESWRSDSFSEQTHYTERRAPDIAKLPFVGFRVEGDRAAYYYLTKPADAPILQGILEVDEMSYLNIAWIPFYRGQDGVWKVFFRYNDRHLNLGGVSGDVPTAAQNFIDEQFQEDKERSWNVVVHEHGQFLSEIHVNGVALAPEEKKVVTVPFKKDTTLSFAYSQPDLYGSLYFSLEGYNLNQTFEDRGFQPNTTYTLHIDTEEEWKGLPITLDLTLFGEDRDLVKEERGWEVIME